MSFFNRRLEDLITLTEGGVIQPVAAVQSVFDLEAQRRQRRQEQQQALLEAQLAAQDAQATQMQGLSDLAIETAGAPTDLEGLLRVATAQQLFSAGRPQRAINSLFLPADTGAAQAGLSRIAPTLPMEELTDIEEAVRDNRTPAEIHQEYMRIYGPQTYARLAPQIDAAIAEAAKRNLSMNIYAKQTAAQQGPANG